MGCWLCQSIFSRRTGTERWWELDPWAWLGTFHVPQMTEELVFSLGNEVNCVGEKLDPRCCSLSCLSVLGHGVVSEQAHGPGSLRGPAGICSAPSHGMAGGDRRAGRLQEQERDLPEAPQRLRGHGEGHGPAACAGGAYPRLGHMEQPQLLPHRIAAPQQSLGGQINVGGANGGRTWSWGV